MPQYHTNMKYLLLLSLLAFIMSCQSNSSGKKGDSIFHIDSVKMHIVKMNETYTQRFTAKDSLFFVDRYCKDAQVLSPNMPLVASRDSIIKFFQGDGSGTDVKMELPIGNVYGDEDLVVEEGTYNFPDGKGGSFDKGKFIALWKQEDGKWKLYREIWNTDMPIKQ
jgi:ketosteroid isomerase-like protein